MKSLISQCIVFNWVIDKYKEVNSQNPCALCEYATENCLDYLSRGYVPLTGEKIEEITEEEIHDDNESTAILENTDEDITYEETTDKTKNYEKDSKAPYTPALPTYKKNLLPKKKKKKRKY